MTDNCWDKIFDERWTVEDKLQQMEGIIELNEKNKSWNKSQLAALKSHYRGEINELKQGAKEFSAAAQDDGIKKELLKELHSHPELERICSKLSPEEIIETLDQIVFCKRKEYDRTKYEVDKMEQKLYKQMSKIEERKCSNGSKVNQAAAAKVNEIANKIQRASLQEEAARIVEISYNKMRKVLEKDSRCFDAILAGLKIDTVIQCQCVIRALELGQRATEDKQFLSKQYEKEFIQMNKMKNEYTGTIDEAKQNLKKMKRACSNMVRTDSFMTIPKSNVLPEYEEDNKSLTVQKIQLENSLERLKETTSALSFDDIFARCEALLKEKYRLLRQLEINTIWKNTELMKQSQAEALYDTITYSVTTTNKK